MKQYDVHFQELVTGETLAYRQTAPSQQTQQTQQTQPSQPSQQTQTQTQQGQTQQPTYVLLHGNQSGSFHWQPLMEKLEEEEEEEETASVYAASVYAASVYAASVYAIDLPGFGDSTYNQRFDSLYELAVHVDAWMEAMGLTQAIVVGWSTGGGVALELAASFPERVSHLVLLSSVGLGGYPIYAVDEQYQPDLTKRLCQKDEIAEHPLSAKPVLNAYATGNKDFMKSVWNQAIYNLNPISDEDFDIYLDGMFKQRNLVDILYALSQFNFTDESNGCTLGSGKIHQITCPVTIIQGRKDLVVPAVWAEEAKAALGNLATLHMFEECGHSIITDDLPGLVKVLKEVS